MVLYLASNTRPDISADVKQCVWFKHNTKASHKTAVKRICWYLQGTKENGLLFNPSKELVVDCYTVGHEYPQDLICVRSTTGFVVTFANCPLLWVSKIQTEIALYTLHSEYVALSHSIRALLPLKFIIKEVIYNLGIESESLKFISSSIVY